MKLKQQEFRCDTCRIGVELANPKCSKCGKQMRSDGDRFFDYVKIHGLKPSAKYDEDADKRYYVFSLGVGPFLINGMTYNASNGSVMMPSRQMRGGKVRIGRMQPTAAIKIRELVEQQIKVLEGAELAEEERAAA